MRWLLVLLLALCTPASARFPHGTSGFTTLATTKIGGGGFAVGIDIQCDSTCVTGGTSTKVIRTDSSGGYWYNPATTNCGNANRTGCWQRLDTALSMPSADLNASYAAFRGTVELRVAPSNTNHLYMLYSMDGTNTVFYSSTDKGSTWTKSTTFTSFAATPNDNPQRLQGPFLAVDPANELVVFSGTRSAGGFRTVDGGANWTAVPTIANANGNSVITVFDPTSAVTSGKTQGVYLSSAGTGIYHSTDGGASWTLLNSAGMPTSVNRMVVDQNGILWVVSGPYGGGTLSKYNGSAWSSFSQLAGSAQSVQISPQNANVIFLLSGGGGSSVSYDAGATWINFTGPGTGAGGVTRVATDAPWLQNTNETFMTAADIKFDPAATQWTTSATNNTIASSGSKSWTTVSTMGLAAGTVVTVYQTSAPANRMQGTVTSNSGTSLTLTITASNGSGAGITDWSIGTMSLYFIEGIGAWTTVPPISTTQTLTFTSITAGIENLVPRWIVSPWGASACATLGASTSVPILTSEDRAVFVLKDQTVYPSSQQINNNNFGSGAIHHGWSADWAGNSPPNLVALIGGNGAPGWSTDCGATWNIFGTSGSTTLPLGFYGNAGGSVAIAATTTNNIVIQQSNQSGGYYTTDGGVTWNVMSFPNSIPSAGALVTSASGISPLTFSSVPAWLSNGVASGASYTFFTASNASGTITGTTGTTATTSGTSGTVNAGDTIIIRVAMGFGNAGFTNMQELAADRVNDQTFYIHNEGVSGVATSAGFYKSVNGGATWTQTCNNNAAPTTCPGGSGGPLTSQLRSVPGHAGDLWFTRGPNFGTSHPASQGFYHSTDGGATWSQPNANVQEVWAFGLGKAKPGGSGYPAIYIYGWVTTIDATNAGVYRSDDTGVTWTRVSANGQAGQFPNNIIDSVTTVEGDANIYGTFYVGFGGSGWATGSLH